MWTKRIATLVATAAVAGAFAAPAAAQNQQEGLVNVAIEDVTVQVPIAVALNICDVNVAVLAELIDRSEPCTATADSAATSGSNPNGRTRQEGLVNVLVDDVVVQAPIALAANVCDVNVFVLARALDDASACEATAESAASRGAGGGGGARSFEPIDLSTVVGAVRLDNDPTTSTGVPL